MAHNEQSKLQAEAEEDETIFILGMVGVGKEPGILIKEDRSGLLERDTVPRAIKAALRLIPLKPKRHTYSVTTT